MMLNTGLAGLFLLGNALAAMANVVGQTPFVELDSELLGLHRQLIEINSVTGTELDVSVFLEKYLKRHHFTVEIQDVPDKLSRRNIYAYMGDKRDTKVLLTSHIDTVPPFFNYSVVDDRIYGRGSVDAKSCVAAQTIAFRQLRDDGVINEGDLALLFVVDEEVRGAGMKFANGHLDIDSWETVIFGEPTELKLGVGHKGMGMANLKAHGKAAHSGYPELGISAIEILIDALSKLIHSDWPESDLLGPTTINIGVISGGQAHNVLAAEAQASILVRISADPDKVTSMLEEIAASNEHLELSDMFVLAPQYLDYDVPGFDTIILSYGTDVPYLRGNFSRHLYGPGSILVAHSAHEYVTISDLHQSVKGYKTLVEHGLKRKE
jgi:acetylornithine deacetylase